MAFLDRIINFGKGIATGYRTGEQLMTEMGDYGHSIFKPEYGRQLAEGAPAKTVTEWVNGKPKTVVQPARQPITASDTPAAFLGAYTARLATDMGQDATRHFYWKYNHPLAIANKVVEQAVDPKMYQSMTPTQRSLLTLGAITPVAASMGIYDITNPGQLFRPKGYAQQYAAPGSEDRRETTQPAQELFERFFMQRQGQPLKYETAKQDYPDLTPERYGNYMRNFYQDKGLLNLGLIKGTTENLQGVPEARLLGFPVTVPAVTAVAGAAAGLQLASKQPGITSRRTVLAGLAGSVGGAAIGNAINEVIAMANRPKLPDLHQYQEQYSTIPVDPNQQNIG
jgi:hypothetical protein